MSAEAWAIIIGAIGVVVLALAKVVVPRINKPPSDPPKPVQSAPADRSAGWSLPDYESDPATGPGQPSKIDRVLGALETQNEKITDLSEAVSSTNWATKKDVTDMAKSIHDTLVPISDLAKDNARSVRRHETALTDNDKSIRRNERKLAVLDERTKDS